MEFEQIQRDISAFADDDSEIVADRTGRIVFVRDGRDIDCRITENHDGLWQVEVNGETVLYKQFLARQLARLDVFAHKLVQKRPSIPAFVEGLAQVDLGDVPKVGKATALLDEQCNQPSPFSSRVVFITADGGHGKTALLKEYQNKTAQRYLDGRGSFLFWHVDLQGRQLLRLSEALMGDLGELRLSGIWMPSLIVLLRHRLLVLAIDGFDELAAEQGSSDALGALALLVQEMGDRGTIVAASRRTFFDTDDYLKRSKVLRQSITTPCEFNQIHLRNWEKEQAVSYFEKISIDGRQFDDPEGVYDDILSELDGNASHPMVSRPFLVAHVARALLRYGLAPAAFIRGMERPDRGVPSVIQAFVNREVEQKWKAKDTGEPYLTAPQHFELLAHVAEEMWRAQRDRLEVEVIRILTTLLLEEWQIPFERRQQILDMVKMHVLLTMPPDGIGDFRAFDHQEFRDYFTAHALAGHVRRAIKTQSTESLSRFLSVGQIPDAVARYAALLLGGGEITQIVGLCRELLAAEWRPTFLQPNVGTFLPFVLHEHNPSGSTTIDCKAVYPSLVMEGTRFRNLRFVNATFSATSFAAVDWQDVTCVGCEFSDVRFDTSSSFERVVLQDCRISGIRLTSGEREIDRVYAPEAVAEALFNLGIRLVGSAQVQLPLSSENVGRKLVHRVLRSYRRTTFLSESQVKNWFHADLSRVRDSLIPLMRQYGIIETKLSHGQGPVQELWFLRKSVEDILRAEGTTDASELASFWNEVSKI